MSPFVSLYLAPVVSQPGRLSRLSGAEGFICLPLSPFTCLSLSPSLDAWHGSLGGRVYLSPFVSLHLSPVASQPGCLARLSGWTDSFVSLCLPSFVWHGLCFPSFVSRCLPAWMPLWVDGFICLPLSHFVCLPLSPSLDAPLGGRIHLSPIVSQPGCVALTLRGFLHFPRFCPFGGVWFAFGSDPGCGHSLFCGCWG